MNKIILITALLFMSCGGTKVSSISLSGNPKTGDVSGTVTFDMRGLPDSAITPKIEHLSFDTVVYFNLNDAKLNIETQVKLRGVCQYINDNVVNNIFLTSGCCPLGTEEYNLILGKKRLDAVYSFIKRQVGNKHFTLINYGETNLVTDELEDYFLNRRCEILVN